MNTPDELFYTEDHEWARPGGDGVRVGITDFAQDALGDIVFVQLPSAGTKVSKGESLGEIESTKSVSEIYAPVSGEVAAVNGELSSAPERINEDPYGEGWICSIVPSAPDELTSLLSADKYRDLTST